MREGLHVPSLPEKARGAASKARLSALATLSVAAILAWLRRALLPAHDMLCDTQEHYPCTVHAAVKHGLGVYVRVVCVDVALWSDLGLVL